LGARQGLTETDVQKIVDRLSGVDQVAISIRDNHVVAMITGHVTESSVAPLEAGLKTAVVSGKSMLLGHADAVDEAVRRLATQDSAADLKQFAEQRHASSEFWVAGFTSFLGPQAASSGVKRFSVAISTRDRLTSDAAFEFDGAPSLEPSAMWPGEATVEGATVHVRMSVAGDEAQQKFGQIVASPLGQRLAALVAAGRYLPARETTVRTQAGPVIYGLDGGPKEVKLAPAR
jgi:hypothetical protein